MPAENKGKLVWSFHYGYRPTYTHPNGAFRVECLRNGLRDRWAVYEATAEFHPRWTPSPQFRRHFKARLAAQRAVEKRGIPHPSWLPLFNLIATLAALTTPGAAS
jgi:hypothetical protein